MIPFLLGELTRGRKDVKARDLPLSALGEGETAEKPRHEARKIDNVGR
jgi:hypothetical protein